MLEHVESGVCIRFVDECEFKVSVSGQRKLERNRSAGFGLEPLCAEIMKEYYIVAGNKLKAVIEQTNITEYKHYNLGTNFGIFITVSTKSLRSLNLNSINFLITYVTKRFV